MRSSKGKKLYAVRSAGGRFKDIQTYAAAHAADLRMSSDAEEAAEAGAKKKAKKKATKKATKKAKKK